MQIDEVIDRVHTLSRTGFGYDLKDDDKKALAIAANELSKIQHAALDVKESK